MSRQDESEPDAVTREREIFAAALEADQTERAAFVRRACAGNSELEQQVLRLLDAHEHADASMALPRQFPSPLADPERVGPYRIVERIGEGGMGIVYLAEQDEPIRRRVALKVIRAGMCTHEVLARFQLERQSLALMDHPNIAKIFDSGATDQGLPYFVMEYVPGRPLLQYCDQHRLGIRSRLDLFVRVCRAIQHAHQKGVIHRDVKPSNVLVTEVDGSPSPKVIDFGVARASDRGENETVFTDAGQWIGTPSYMSPEQVDRSLDIDTRSDVYSLGVVLYELLTGTLPFEIRSMRRSSILDIQRMIREVDPPRPSTRLGSLGEGAAEIADRRRTARARLRTALRGDLDQVVMKAIEKNRERRFETAEGLARDLERYLRDEPVTATPPNRWYVTRKFVARHRGLVSAAVIVGLALALGAIGTGLGFVRANRQRDLAETRATRLRQVAEFQQAMLQQIDAAEAGLTLFQDLRARFEASFGDDPRTREQQSLLDSFSMALGTANTTDAAITLIDRTILRPSIEAAHEQFGDQPLIESSLVHTIGGVYYVLGRYRDAIPLFEAALTTRRELLGNESPETLDTVASLGGSLLALDRLEEARPLYTEAYETRARVLGEEHPDTLDSINNMGSLLQESGEIEKAEPWYRRAYEISQRVLGDDEKTFVRLGNLAKAIADQGRLEESLELNLEALAGKRRVLREDDPSLIDTLNNLGALYYRLDRKEEAEEHWFAALEKNRRVRGEHHIKTLISLNNLAYLYNKSGRFDDAEVLYEDALAKLRDAYGESHGMTLECVNNLAALHRQRGRNEDVIALITETLAATRRGYTGHDAWKLARALQMRGIAQTSVGAFAGSERDLLEAYTILVEGEDAVGPDDYRAQACARQLANLYDGWHRRDPDGGYRAKSRQWRSRLTR